MIERIKKLLNDPKLPIKYLNNKGYLRWVSDEKYIKWNFKEEMGYALDLKNPQTFNEKLQWIKLYDRNPNYTSLVDKYDVRKYVKESIGEQYLIPNLGVWSSVDEIDWDLLPNQFVMKTTHVSGDVLISRDKEQFDIKKAKKIFRKSLRKNYYYYNREWPYKNVKPRIIAEELLVDSESESLNDYKFYCFNGEPKVLFVASDREEEVKFDFFDLDFSHLPIGLRNSKKIINKPDNFNEMIEITKKLSKNIPHVRIDLYSVNNRIYFGEYTFFSESGFEKFHPNHEKYTSIFGEWIEL